MSSEPFDGDPYRTAPSLVAPESEPVFRDCPRCGDVLTRCCRVFACARGCGVWLPVDLVFEVATFEELDACDFDAGTLDRPAPLARCARCSLPMKLRRHGPLVFDFCPGHGVWFDRGERQDFERAGTDGLERVAAAIDDELQRLGGVRERISLQRVRAWFDAAWFGRARGPDPQPAPRPDPQPAPWPDPPTAPPRDADEREELAWLDRQRTRLEHERG